MPRGIARLAAEFLDRLGLRDVTLVGNDTGGALVQLLMGDSNGRMARAVLVSCDAFDNFPPGLTRIRGPVRAPPGLINFGHTAVRRATVPAAS